MRTRLGAAVAALSCAALLSGCAVDAGASVAADFEEWMGERPGLESITLVSQNSLPFIGAIDASLVMAADATPEQVDDVVQRAMDFDPGRHAASVSLVRQIGSAVVSAGLPHEGDPSEVLDLAETLATAADVTELHVGGPTGPDLAIEAVVAELAQAPEAFRALNAVLDPVPRVDGLRDDAELRVRDAAGAGSISTEAPGTQTATHDLAATVVGEVTVTSMLVTEDIARFTVPEAQAAKAEALAGRLLPGGDVRVTGE